jgi:hypothetical protein
MIDNTVRMVAGTWRLKNDCFEGPNHLLPCDGLNRPRDLRTEPPHSQLTTESTDEKEQTQVRIEAQHHIQDKKFGRISIRVGSRGSLTNAFETRAEMLEDKDDLIDRQLGSQAETLRGRGRAEFMY